MFMPEQGCAAQSLIATTYRHKTLNSMLKPQVKSHLQILYLTMGREENRQPNSKLHVDGSHDPRKSTAGLGSVGSAKASAAVVGDVAAVAAY